MLVTLPGRHRDFSVNSAAVALVEPLLSGLGSSDRTQLTLIAGSQITVYDSWDNVTAALNAADPAQQLADWWNGNGPAHFADRLQHAISESLVQARPR